MARHKPFKNHGGFVIEPRNQLNELDEGLENLNATFQETVHNRNGLRGIPHFSKIGQDTQAATIPYKKDN